MAGEQAAAMMTGSSNMVLCGCFPAGQLEFEEFVLILTTKLGVGGGQRESAWQELPDGSWSMRWSRAAALGRQHCSRAW
jgi:hypothetical protein